MVILQKKIIYFFATIWTSHIFALPPTFHSKGGAIRVNDNGTLRVASQLTASKGTIAKTSAGTISGEATETALIFDQGCYGIDDGKTLLTSSLNIFSGNQLILDSGQTLRGDSGKQVDSILVKGAGNKLEGINRLSSDVTLEDSSAGLTIDLPNKFDVDLILNGGTITLENDLSFADSKSFIGTGTFNLSGYRLTMGAKPLTFSAAITWQDAADITLNGKTTLTSTWTFDGDNIIQGNGNILDISGGTIVINASTALSLTDIHLKGLGNGNITFTNTTSHLNLANVTIEMDNDKTFSTGQLFVTSPTTIITKDKTLTFDTSSVLNVDGTTLWYDTLTFANASNISASGGNLALTNNGRITQVIDIADFSDTVAAVGTIDTALADLHFSTNTTLTYDLFLSDDHLLKFEGDCVLDGNGHKIFCSNKQSNQIIVNAGFDVSVKNTKVNNFSGSHLSLGAGSTFRFGQGSELNMLPGESLTQALYFGDNAILHGDGSAINLGVGGELISGHANGLTIKNTCLSGVSSTNIRSEIPTAKIILENTSLLLSNNFTFTTGCLEIEKKTEICGEHQFSYQTDQASTINTNSELIIQPNTIFQYATNAANKDLIVFTDATSQLTLIGATLDVTSTGIRLKTGTLNIESLVKLQSAATVPPEGIYLGNDLLAEDLTVNIEPGASLKLTSGYLVYENTT